MSTHVEIALLSPSGRAQTRSPRSACKYFARRRMATQKRTAVSVGRVSSCSGTGSPATSAFWHFARFRKRFVVTIATLMEPRRTRRTVFRFRNGVVLPLFLVGRIPALRTPGNTEAQPRRRAQGTFSAQKGLAPAGSSGLDNCVWDCDRRHRAGFYKLKPVAACLTAACRAQGRFSAIAAASYWRRIRTMDRDQMHGRCMWHLRAGILPSPQVC